VKKTLWKRLVPLGLLVLLVVNLAAPVSAYTEGGFTSTVSIDAARVEPGQTVPLTVSVTSADESTALVDVEIYDDAWNQVFQSWFEQQSFAAGQTLTYDVQWEVPETLPAGRYSVKVATYADDWSTNLHWNDEAAVITIGEAGDPGEPTEPGEPTDPAGPGDFTAVAITDPATANPGETVTVTAAVTSAKSGSAIVDVEIYDPSWNQVFQQWFPAEAFTANEERLYSASWEVPAGAAGTYTVQIGLFSADWSESYLWNTEAGAIAVGQTGPSDPTDPTEPTDPGQPPLTMPEHFGIGLQAYPSENGIYGWMPDSRIAWDFAYQYLVGGVNTGNGWAHWNDNAQFPLWYAQGSAQNGYIPIFTYYQLLQSSGSCNECSEAERDLSNLNNPAVMADYFEDFAMLMKRLGSGAEGGVTGYGGLAIVHVEPDLSGYAQHAVLNNDLCYGFCSGEGNDATLLRAAVSSSGHPDVAGLPDNWQGFNLALLRLRDKYAPNVKLAYHVSTWATMQDVASSADPSLDPALEGTKVGEFANQSGVQPVLSDVSTYDLLFNDVSDRDAGYYKYELGRENAFWDKLNVDLPNFHRWEAFVNAAVQATGTRVIVWQIPLGNQYFSTMNNSFNHWQDNKVEYFFSHIEELASVGIIGLLFGPGMDGMVSVYDLANDDATNPAPICTTDGLSQGEVCNTNQSIHEDDDGGYLRMAADAYDDAPYMLP